MGGRRGTCGWPALVLLGAFVSAMPRAYGAEPPPEPEEAELADVPLEELAEIKVVTPAAKPVEMADAPGTVYVFTRETIELRGYRYLTQLLEDIPEIDVHYNVAAEYSQTFTIRGITGLSNEQFIIQLDGVRLNAMSGTPHSTGRNFSLVNAERVEVVIGPTSSLYGADAFAGVVNIVTRSGAEIEGSRLSGSFGRYLTSEDSFVVGYKVGKEVSLAVWGSLYRSDEADLPDAYPDEFAWYFDRYLTGGEVKPTLASEDTVVLPIEPYATPARSYMLGLRADFGDFRLGYTRHGDSHSSSLPGLPEVTLYDDDAVYTYAIQTAYARYTLKALDDRLELMSQLSGGTYQVDPGSQFKNVFSRYDSGFKYEQHLSLRVDETLTFDFRDWLSFGVGLTIQDFSGQPKSADMGRPYDPTLSSDSQEQLYPGTDIVDAQGTSLATAISFYPTRYQNYGLFLELQSKPITWFSGTAGVRVDYNTRYGATVNPRVGLVFAPFERTRLKLLYGHAYLAPSVYVAYQNFGNFEPDVDGSGAVVGLKSSFFRVPNPDLAPQTLRTGELALAQRIGRTLRLGLDAYYTRVTDLWQLEGSMNQTFEGWPVAFRDTFVNSGSAQAWGGTAQVQWTPRWGELKLDPRLAYTYTKGDIDGSPLPTSSRHVVKGGVDVRWNDLSLSLEGTYRGKARHPLQVDAADEPIVIDDWYVLNLYARYAELFATQGVHFSAWLEIRNLLDARYFDVSNGRALFAGAPQDPFRFLVGLDVDF